MRLKLYRGKWAVVGRHGGATWRRSLGTADRTIAERRLQDLKTERPGDTVADAIAIYLREKESSASAEAMGASWKALAPLFGHLRPDQITRALCRDFAAKRRLAGRADGTIIKDLSLLRAALKYTKQADGANFELPPAPPPRERYLTREEYGRLLAGCKVPHIRLFVVLALATAGRASAVLQLTWDRVDFIAGQVRLGKGERRTKGRATVPMTATAREALLEAKKIATSDYVIEWAGNPVASVKRGFREACATAKLPGVTPHVLRHTAAVWMAEARVPMAEIAQFLGHTDSRLTYRVYARYSPDHLRHAAGALEAGNGRAFK